MTRPTRPHGVRRRAFLGTLLAAALAVPLAATSVGAAPGVTAVTSPAVVVDAGTKHQTIRGFGGMNHPLWIGDLTASQRTTAFGNGTDQLGMSVLRIWVSDDRSQWSREVATAKAAIDRGAIVFASPWNPPASMTETATVGAPQGAGTLYQAETGSTLRSAAAKSEHTGYTGTGFVDFSATSGASMQLDNVSIGTAGAKNLAIRYALGSTTARTLDVYVNGTRALTGVTFNPTGGWSSWGSVQVQVPMRVGGNTVRLETTGTEGPNVDSVRVTGWVESTGKRLRHDKYADYAKHLNDFVAFMKSNGVDLYAISVQNEPDYAHEWTAWTPTEIQTFMRDHAGSITTRVIAPESFQYTKSVSDPILEDPKALANMDILGAHLYGTSYADFPYPLFQEKGAGKDLWMTEVYYPNSTMTSGNAWPESLSVARHIHHAMADAEFQAYVWWYIRRGYGPMQEDGTLSKRGYAMAAFSKYVRPGAVRLEAESEPRQGVYVSAYRNTDGKIAVVVVNQNDASVTQPLSVKGATASKVSSYTTDATRNLAPRTGIAVSGGAFSATLPAQSVTTFVVEG